jgi:DNA-directed RNA polymerase
MNDIQRQIKLERDAIHDGVIRYNESRKYQLAADSKPGRDLVGNSLESLANAIRAEQLALKTTPDQKLPKWGAALLSLDPEKSALITLGTLLNSITRSEFDEGVAPGTTAIANEIGHWCRVERIYDHFRGTKVDVAKDLCSRQRSRDARRRADAMAAKLDDAKDWIKTNRAFHLGDKLISLAVQFACFEGQPVFELKTVREGSGKSTKTTQRVALTAAADDWICSHEATLASLPSPVYMPMVVPPLPVKSLSEGGYYMTPWRLLKRQPNSRGRQLFEKADMAVVLSAVNSMQNTAWRINKDIYRLMQAAWNAGNTFFGLKTHAFEELPPSLPDDADPKEIKERRRERSETHNRNNRIKGLQKVMAFRLALCARLLDELQFYFPYQLDHRGRAYPVPQLVNPQSDDIGRCLLEFAEGKPLGESGARWLAIHIANCYWKKKKVSFEERLAWVHQHEKEILDFAENPLRPHPFWDEADKPWCFLRACLEWKVYREQGPGFISHLPVSMDGTCNGYQHLSAMGRDPIGGRATNLLPFDEPQDIYQENADHAGRRIKRDADAGNSDADAAMQLVGQIDRSDVKHATMTTPYGVTRGTIYKQLLESTFVKYCKDPQKCAKYLARVLEETIPEVAVEAGKIMKLLREIARTLGKANRGMAWTTQTGFPVVHEMREPKAVRIRTAAHTFTVYQEDETRKIDARKQADGIVAHLVHSLDASHMMLTVNRLYAEGLRHFSMVHDSFGVHACDIDLLNRVIREEFVRIYSEPVLQNFLNEQRAANPDVDLPELPPPGNLDIRQVLSSQYFFA